MKFIYAFVSCFVFVILSGCASTLPDTEVHTLVYGESEMLGFSFGSMARYEIDIVLGYKKKMIATVPVPVQVRDTDNDSTQIATTGREEFDDVLSVLAQFEANTETSQGNVGLGKFFATGAAAEFLAGGYSCRLAGEAASDCDFTDTTEFDRE